MNFWTRLVELVSRGTALVLDEAATVRTLERGLAGVKAYAAGAIAAERRLGREIRRQHLRVERQRQRVLRFADDEEAAHRAFLLLREHTELLHGLHVHHDAARQAAATARIAVDAVAARLHEARQIRQLLSARQRQAELHEPVASLLREPTRSE